LRFSKLSVHSHSSVPDDFWNSLGLLGGKGVRAHSYRIRSSITRYKYKGEGAKTLTSKSAHIPGAGLSLQDKAG
jgi:hypothetical protein